METKRIERKLCVLVSSAMLALALAAHSSDGPAQDATQIADLERGFWVCDYVGTTRGVHATPVDLCSTVMDELKLRKFGGDYEALLEWWRENKPAEHGKLAAEDRGPRGTERASRK